MSGLSFMWLICNLNTYCQNLHALRMKKWFNLSIISIESLSESWCPDTGWIWGGSGTNPMQNGAAALGVSWAGKLPPLVQNSALWPISEVWAFFLRGCDGLGEGRINQVESLISALLGIQKLKLSIIFCSNFHLSLSKEVIVLAEKKCSKI